MKKALALVLALTMTLGMAACGTTASSAPASGSAAAGDSSTASSASTTASGASTTASGASTTGTATGSMTNGLYPGTPDPESVTINITSEPPDMNSVTTTDATAISIMRDVLEGLTSLDQENKPVPGGISLRTASFTPSTCVRTQFGATASLLLRTISFSLGLSCSPLPPVQTTLPLGRPILKVLRRLWPATPPLWA